jgi:hypothetical protein
MLLKMHDMMKRGHQSAQSPLLAGLRN